MQKIISYHVPDPRNIGDLFASPVRYFEFPGFQTLVRDIREVTLQNVETSCSIIGGGGVLSSRFLSNIQAINHGNSGKKIIWGAGQQLYGKGMSLPERFDYQPYRENCDLFGIRDYNLGFDWVPCPSCMHSSFDKVRTVTHEFVLFSHKKFQISFPGIPRFTNETSSLEEVLDFLASGETVLTSSFHGAYWATLLGRKVLVFPFNSKFYTMRHQPAIYPVEKWTNIQFRLRLLGKTLYERSFSGEKYICETTDWRSYLGKCRAYPESLSECRDRNRQFYEQVMNLLVG